MKKIYNIFLLLFALFLLQLNVCLYYKPDFKQTAQGPSNQDVKAQLAFLKTALDNGVGEEMQQIYPEGLVFTYALYGLAWCNYLKQVGTDTSLLALGRTEVNLALNILQSERAKSIFTKRQGSQGRHRLRACCIGYGWGCLHCRYSSLSHQCQDSIVSTIAQHH